MNDFNQYNNVVLMSAIQEFYDERARRREEAEAAAPVEAAPVAASRLAHFTASIRRIATTPLPLPWRRVAA